MTTIKILKESVITMGKKCHMARACWLKKKFVGSNAVTTNSEEDWDLEALFVVEEESMVENQGAMKRGKKGTLRRSSKDMANLWRIGL